jgi:hypothetical protein
MMKMNQKTYIKLSDVKGKSVADAFAMIGWRVVDSTVMKPPIIYCSFGIDNGEPVLVLWHEEGESKGGFFNNLKYMLKGKACIALQKVGML